MHVRDVWSSISKDLIHMRDHLDSKHPAQMEIIDMKTLARTLQLKIIKRHTLT